MTFHLAKDGPVFIPADEQSREKVQKIGQGEVVECKSIDQRNYEHHKKFFVLIKLAWDNLPEKFDGHYPHPDDLREELIILAGFYRERTDFYGNKQKKAESIAFDKMGQERFDRLYNRVLDLVCRLIDVDKPEIMDELVGFM